MKTIMLAATVASFVAWAPAAAPPLELRVITGSPQGFLVNSDPGDRCPRRRPD